MSHVFDLEIFSSCKIQILILSVVTKVTCLVISCSFSCRCNDSLYKSACSLLFIMIIAICQRLSCNTDLTCFARFCNLCAGIIKKKYSSSIECLTCRNHFAILEFPLYRIPGTVTGNLWWSVQIDKFGLWQSLLPEAHLLHRHNFAAEHDQSCIFRDLIFQSLQGRDQTQGRNSPDHNCNLFVAEIVEKLRRKCKQTLRNQHQRCSCCNCGINILDRNIKIKRSLIANAVPVRNLKLFRKMTNKINDCLMADCHTFRFSGRTWCKNTIKKICIFCKRTSFHQFVQFLCSNCFIRWFLFQKIDLSLIAGIIKLMSVCTVCNHQICFKNSKDILKPFKRLFRIDHYIKTSCINNAKHSG